MKDPLTTEQEVAKLRAMLDDAHTALLNFVTVYNGRPSNFRKAEEEAGEALHDAFTKIDDFLYPVEGQ